MPLSHLDSALASLPLVLAAMAQAAPVPEPAQAEAQLRAINHRFVNAFAVADVEFIDRLTASDFLLTGSGGDWITRAQHIELMRKAPVAAGVSYDDVRVRLFGEVALVHGLFEANAEPGAPTRVRYTDVYHWDGSRWRLVGAQNTPVREGVARQQVLGQAPASAPWRGQDPSGDDDTVLRALNEQYVRAFREADVSWYNAHLSPDYVVINSDGSFKDRAQTLADFSRPTFATHMKSFPVDKVQVRRFGALALIHAENAYEMKDGRRGVSRYTDIWHRQVDGRWLCVAAHITAHKQPT
jgi:uncharacterized protein (TIGR02246 family)